MRRRRPNLCVFAAVSAAVALGTGCTGGDDQFLEQVETSPPPAQPGLPAADVTDVLIAVAVSVRPSQGVGVQSTGLLWGTRGTVVTVNPSLRRGSDVLLASGKTVKGRVVGRDAVTGIVVIRVSGRVPAPPPVARDVPRLGSQAVALSEDANGIARSTVATVSALAPRPLGGEPVTVVELDQAVSSPGAPVMNRRAELIGMHVASAGARALVLPAAIVARAVSTVRAGAAPAHRTLGTQVVPLTRRVISDYDLAAVRGVLVKVVDEGSTAARSGVRPGDILVRIGEREIHSVSDYLVAYYGTIRELEIVRGTRRLVLPLTRPRVASVPSRKIG